MVLSPRLFSSDQENRRYNTDEIDVFLYSGRNQLDFPCSHQENHRAALNHAVQTAAANVLRGHSFGLRSSDLIHIDVTDYSFSITHGRKQLVDGGSSAGRALMDDVRRIYRECMAAHDHLHARGSAQFFARRHLSFGSATSATYSDGNLSTPPRSRSPSVDSDEAPRSPTPRTSTAVQTALHSTSNAELAAPTMVDRTTILENRIRELESQLHEVTTHRDLLQADLLLRRRSLDSARSDLQDTNEDARRLADGYRDLQRDNATLYKGLERQGGEIAGSLETLARQSALLETTEAERNELATKLAQLESFLPGLEAKLQEAKDALKTANDKIDTQAATISNGKQRLQLSQNMGRQAFTEAEAAKQRVAALEEQLRTLRGQITDSATALLEAEVNIRAAITPLQSALADAQARVAEVQAKELQLTYELTSARTNSLPLLAQQAADAAEIAKLQEAITTTLAALAAAEKQADSLGEVNREITEAFGLLESNNASLKAELDRLRARLAQLEATQQRRTSTLTATEALLASKEHELTATQDLLAQTTSQRNALVVALQKMQPIMEQLAANNETLSGELNDAMEALNQAAAENGTQAERIRSLEINLDEDRLSIESLIAEKQALQQSQAALQGQLFDAREALDALRKTTSEKEQLYSHAENLSQEAIVLQATMLTAAQAEVKTLERKLAEAEQQLRVKQGILENHLASVKNLTEQSAKAEADKAPLLAKLREQNGLLHALETELAAKVVKITALSEQSEARKIIATNLDITRDQELLAHADEKAALTAQISALGQEVTSLEREMLTRFADVTELEHQAKLKEQMQRVIIGVSNRKVTELTAELEALRAQQARAAQVARVATPVFGEGNLDPIAEGLKEELADKQTRNDQLITRAEDLDKKIKSLTAQYQTNLTALEQELEEAQSAKKSADTQFSTTIAELRTRNESLTNDVSLLQANNAFFISENGHLEGDKTRLTAKIATLDRQILALTNKHREEIAQIREETDQARQKLEASHASVLARKNHEISELKKDITHLEGCRDGYEKKNRSLNSSLLNKSHELERLQDSLNNSDVSSLSETEKKSLEEADKAIECLTARLEKQERTHVAELVELEANYKARLEALTRELEKKDSQFQSSEEEMATLLAEKEREVRGLEEQHRSTVADLNKQLRELSTSIEANRSI